MGTPLGIAVQLLPTPTARDLHGAGEHGNPTLAGALLPTPTARLGDPRRGAPSPEVGAARLASGRRNLDDSVATLLPTPKARDWKGTGPADLRRKTPDLNGLAGGQLLPTPTATDAGGGPRAVPERRTHDGVDHGPRLRDVAAVRDRWGRYAAAIGRWEAALDRPAPDPTEPRPATMANVRACADDWGCDGWAAQAAVRAGWWGARLAPPFVEWMMGADAGTVTAVPGVSRSAQLARLGNGVVRQQAAAAVLALLPELAALGGER